MRDEDGYRLETENEQLREEVWGLWEMIEKFPSILEVTDTGNVPSAKEHVTAMRIWHKQIKEQILHTNASWLRERHFGEKNDG
jgi:hypothetical protein